jgi:DNA-binding NarL/FixJ family response regulator
MISSPANEQSYSHSEKLKGILKQFLNDFPFLRASIYSYSPLSGIGEGLYLLDTNGISSIREIREDVRNIGPVYTALGNHSVQFVTDVRQAGMWPEHYIHRFELSSLWVIPVIHKYAILGALIADRIDENTETEEGLLYRLSCFGKEIGAAMIPRKLSEKHPLSKREVEVLQGIAWGETTKSLSKRLGISEFTVRDYVTSATKKLGVEHRTQAVAVAMREGWIV